MRKTGGEPGFSCRTSTLESAASAERLSLMASCQPGTYQRDVLEALFTKGHRQIDRWCVERQKGCHIRHQFNGDHVSLGIIGVNQQEFSQRPIEIRPTSDFKLANRTGCDDFWLNGPGAESAWLNGADSSGSVPAFDRRMERRTG